MYIVYHLYYIPRSLQTGRIKIRNFESHSVHQMIITLPKTEISGEKCSYEMQPSRA